MREGVIEGRSWRTHSLGLDRVVSVGAIHVSTKAGQAQLRELIAALQEIADEERPS